MDITLVIFVGIAQESMKPAFRVMEVVSLASVRPLVAMRARTRQCSALLILRVSPVATVCK